MRASQAINAGAERLWALMPAAIETLAYRTLSAAVGFLPRRLRAKPRGFIARLRGQRDYTIWIGLYEQTDAAAREAALADIAQFADPPLISVLMPVFNPAPDHLRAAIESVRTQFYPHWELCIADDKSTDPAIASLLREAQALDDRIKVVWRATNGHISAASNSALASTSGTFVALLDHDDLLSPTALYEVAAGIVAHPEVDLIYSDEDRIDDRGRRSTPYMKPGWNLELLLGQNLVSHLGVYRRSLIQRIGGFRTGFEGSQDYDLTLRAAAATTQDRILHIPKVLYHWRQGGRTASFSERSRQRCEESARRAVQTFLSSCALGARVEPNPSISSWNRVIYPVPVPEPLVSVIIPSRNHAALLGRTMQGLLQRTNYPAFEAIIVDNGSDEADALALLERLSHDKRVRVLRSPGPFNYSALNNQAVRQAAGSLVLLLNNDIDVIGPGWLREMVSHAIRPEIGAVGAKLLYPDNTVQHAGLTVGMFGVAGHPYMRAPARDRGYFGQLQIARNVTAVTGACLLVRREAYLEVGGLDEVALPVAFNDIDFCLKLAERGYRNLWTPFAELYHLESASRGSDETPEHAGRFGKEVACMMQRWAHWLDRDPCWSPNLSLRSNDVTLAFPPRGMTVPVADDPSRPDLARPDLARPDLARPGQACGDLACDAAVRKDVTRAGTTGGTTASLPRSAE